MTIREVRVLVKWRGCLRKLCKIAVTRRDASFYLFPYAAQGEYYYGSRTIPEKQTSITFDFTEGVIGESTPKLSIHETGEVKVEVGDEKVGPLHIPPLATLSGQHIASVSPDAFEALPLFTERLRIKGSEIDHVIPADDDATNGRLAIYVNGRHPVFDAQDCRFILTLRRETLDHPVYFAVKPIGQPLLGNEARPGVTIIAGWDPLKSVKDDFDLLYIRGR